MNKYKYKVIYKDNTNKIITVKANAQIDAYVKIQSSQYVNNAKRLILISQE